MGGLRDATVTVGQVLRMTAAGSGSRASYWYFISSEPAEGITLSIGERDGAITAAPTAAGSVYRDGAGARRLRVRGDGFTFTVTANCPRIAVADVPSFEVEVSQTFRRTARRIRRLRGEIVVEGGPTRSGSEHEH